MPYYRSGSRPAPVAHATKKVVAGPQTHGQRAKKLEYFLWLKRIRSMKIMKKLTLFSTILASTFLAAVPASRAADTAKPKPYPLDKCVVSDEKIGADPSMKPYIFTHEGQEVKLCCKSCLKDFKKDTAKYMAKIEAANKKAK
jgi:hypothetical protein